MPSKRLIVCCLISPFLFALSIGLESSIGFAQSQSRGFTELIETESTDHPGYRIQWAVIVGINYDHLKGDAKIEIPQLSTAENDAQAVSHLLLENYGYTSDTTKLLLGENATAREIRKLFGDSFLGNRDRVTEDDSVVFYFAGHGNRRETIDETEKYVGMIYPSDVEVLDGSGVETATCLRIEELMSMLEDYCPARHKLVILDSCHSGEVFNFKARRGGVNRGFRAQLFRDRAFQAIAAARSNQVAADADSTGKHSPFTSALLTALEHGPDAGNRSFFTASELFAYIPKRIREMPNVQQNPKGSWVSGEGDFYFIPKTLSSEDSLALARAIPRSTGTRENSDSDKQAFMSNSWLFYGVVSSGLVIGFTASLWYLRSRLKVTSVSPETASHPPTSSEQLSQARKESSPELVLETGPVLSLKISGSPYAYQALPGVQNVFVGRQRRKAGLSGDAGNDFVLRAQNDEENTLKISRRHLEFEQRDGNYSVIDRSSAGTLLNDVLLTKNKATAIHTGDKLLVAGVLTLEITISETPVHGMRQGMVEVGSLSGSSGQIVAEASIGDMVTVE